MILIAMLGVNFSSCGGSDDDGLKDIDVPNEADPDGTVVLNLQNNGDFLKGIFYNAFSISQGDYTHTHIYSDGDKISSRGPAIFKIWMDENDNLCLYGMHSDGGEIVSIGKVKGLGSINKIPSSGWSLSVAFVPGTGYVVRNKVITLEDEINRNNEYGYFYSRIYAVEYKTNTYNEIIGGTIKYQAEWKSEDIQ